jgi:isopentenyl-diphosphate delta-isomerase
MSQEEKLWLVDEKDEPIGDGWQWRSQEQGKNWKNFRVINAFFKRADGRLWIPRRTSAKRMFPNCLDVSVGGHVEYGESYENCFARETQEETGIDIRNFSCKVLGKLSPFEHQGLSAFMKVWEVQVEDVPNYNPADFSEVYWLTPDEFRARIASGDKAKGDLPILIDLFYPKA